MSDLEDKTLGTGDKAQEPVKQIKTVFDMGRGQNITISGLTFTNGLFITEEEDEIRLLQNYRKQLPYSMSEAAFDESNPEHIRNNKPATADTSHIINGVHTSAHFARKQDLGINDILNAATDGSALAKLEAAPDSPAAGLIDIDALTSSMQQAKQQINTNTVNLANVLAQAEPVNMANVLATTKKK